MTKSRPTLAAIAILIAFAAPALAGSATLKVPQDFATIQAAVDNANEGDTIIVKKGTFTENVVVDVPGLSIIGKKKVVIDAGNSGAGIFVNTVDGVALENLRIVNATTGIQLEQANDCVVSRCQISNSVAGVSTNLGGRNLIEKTTIKNASGDGIALTSSQNVVTQCKLLGTAGVNFFGSNNVIEDSVVDGGGVNVGSGTGHLVAGNTVRSADTGIRLVPGGGAPCFALDNAVSDCEDGIVLDSIDGQVVQGNSIRNSSQSGIFCDESGGHLIASNAIKKSTFNGIDQFGSDGNVIQGNSVKKSGSNGLAVDGDDNLIATNTIKKSGNLDIQQSGGSTGNVYIGNEVATTNL